MPKKMLLPSLLISAISIVCSAQSGNNHQPTSRVQAQCEFSGGKSITVNYPAVELRALKDFAGVGANQDMMFVTNMKFVTTEDLVTAKAPNIPAGEYIFSIVSNAGRWTLILDKSASNSTSPQNGAKELARPAHVRHQGSRIFRTPYNVLRSRRRQLHAARQRGKHPGVA
jgi:hypothetical protein